MIAFLAAVLVVIGTSVGAAFILEGFQKSSADKFQTSSIRINPEDGQPPKGHGVHGGAAKTVK